MLLCDLLNTTYRYIHALKIIPARRELASLHFILFILLCLLVSYRLHCIVSGSIDARVCHKTIQQVSPRGPTAPLLSTPLDPPSPNPTLCPEKEKMPPDKILTVRCTVRCGDTFPDLRSIGCTSQPTLNLRSHVKPTLSRKRHIPL